MHCLHLWMVATSPGDAGGLGSQIPILLVPDCFGNLIRTFTQGLDLAHLVWVEALLVYMVELLATRFFILDLLTVTFHLDFHHSHDKGGH